MFTPNYPPGDIGIIEQQIEKHYGEHDDDDEEEIEEEDLLNNSNNAEFICDS